MISTLFWPIITFYLPPAHWFCAKYYNSSHCKDHFDVSFLIYLWHHHHHWKCMRSWRATKKTAAWCKVCRASHKIVKCITGICVITIPIIFIIFSNFLWWVYFKFVPSLPIPQTLKCTQYTLPFLNELVNN